METKKSLIVPQVVGITNCTEKKFISSDFGTQFSLYSLTGNMVER